VNEVRARFRGYYIVNLMWLPVTLVFLGILILGAEPSTDWAVAAIALLVVAAGILYMLRRAIARFGSNAMTIDVKGIDHWTWGLIPWSEIEEIEFSKTFPAFTFVYFLKVRVRDPRVYLGNISGIERWLRTKSLKTNTGSLELLLNGLTENPQRINDVANSLFEERRR
jgi:hypothetical protein